MTEFMVQYIVVRMDLINSLKWPLGAVIAQACHASTAAMHIYRDHSNTKAYASDLDRMHKVVLQAPDENSLRHLATELTDAKVDHKLWIEQPENVATCLATKPYNKQEIQNHFKQFRLMR